MKLNNSNKQDKIIGTDDIFISSNNSSLGDDLESLLTKLDLEIEDLKRNVKWLYKYGGVGGSGGSGGSENTKAKFTITFTNTNNISVTQNLKDGAVINILKGTSITVTCQITSRKLLPEYRFLIGDSYIIMKSTEVAGSITITPQENALYTATVLGETLVNITFNVFTDIITTKSRIEANGEIYPDNSAIYESTLNGAIYTFTMENNQPSIVYSDITDVLINNNTLDKSKYEITTSEDGVTNKKTTKLKIDLSNIFTEGFGIYLITVNYKVLEEDISTIDTFIYLSDEAFVYCYSSAIQVYNKKVESPSSSNAYQQTVYYKVYAEKGAALGTTYVVTINGQLQTGSVKAGEIKSYSFLNETTATDPTPIQLSFKINNNTELFDYYVYLTKPKEVSYFFKDNDGNNYYLAIYTTTTKDARNDEVMQFPTYNGKENAYVITKQQSYKLNKITQLRGDIVSAKNNIKSYITSFITANDAVVDGLFSFGIKYSSNNYSQAILSIADPNGTEVTLYKNYIKFNNTEYEICIPKDGKYHLVLLYFKSNYSNSPDLETSIKSYPQKLCVFIDGIIESKLIDITDYYIQNNSTITYYVGNWNYNHIGVATFNAKQNISVDSDTQYDCILKYLLDVDPIIPVNYYNAYKLKELSEQGYTLDNTIYDSLGIKSGQSTNLWINYYNYDNDKYFTKLINIDPATIASLLGQELEMYCIVPEQTTYLEFDQKEGFNLFLYNTFTSYSEDDATPAVNCYFLKWVGGLFVDLITSLEGYTVQYRVKYLGSSTLLYSCKNFEISTVDIVDEDAGTTKQIYFTPDVNLFPRLEQSFNLKADMVDSSHSNNVIVGNFVNDYMESPFSTNLRTYNACLTGKPILLFIKNELSNNANSDYIFLGIYSMNLNRGSVHNLGYSRLLTGSGTEIEVSDASIQDENCCDTITKFHLLGDGELDKATDNLAVAEILGNGILYDFSKFDEVLLAKEILGDFYISDNNKISKTFSKNLINPFKALAKIINSHYKSTFDYTDPCKQSDNQYSIISKYDCYYKDFNGNKQPIPLNALIIKASTLQGYTENVPYHTLKNNTGLIGNPCKQYHLVCNVNEEVFKIGNESYYYVEDITLDDYNIESDPKIDLKSTLQYYIVCMAFGMADSVLKNLTIKCPHLDADIWYPEFYDMDTAFGKNNAGGNLSFLAFSNYVDESGNIIYDYSPISGDESLFDIPSSFLFLYAKYYGLIVGGDYKDLTPAIEWCNNLRKVGGKFENADVFCEKYIDNYFGDINPLIWNLNYFYKYFSYSKNTSNSDTEESRFSGTRRYSRKEFIAKRFRYLDAMFGVNTAQHVGKNSLDIFDGATIPNNDDITMNKSIVPAFTKGVVGRFNATVLDDPKTPIFFRTSANKGVLQITDNTGKARFMTNITSSELAGFYGTLNVLSLNEFGQFLKAESLPEYSIEGNRITTIDITASGTYAVIDLDKVPEVETINIVNNSKITYTSVKITGNQKLKAITIKNLLCNSLSIQSDNTITLSIQNSTINSLSLQDLTISTFTYSNNKVTTENWSNIKIEKLAENTISNSACTNLSMNNVNIPTLTYSVTTGALKTLSLRNITTDNITITHGLSLTSLTLENIKAQNINFNTLINLPTPTNTTPWHVFPENSNSIEEINVTVESTVESIGISFPYFYELKTVNVTGTKLKKCYLNDRAFAGCDALTELTNNKIEYIIKGEFAFNRTNSLSNETKLACKLDETKEYQGIFNRNDNIDIDFVINWFNTHSASSLQRLFCYCTGITLEYKNKLPTRYGDFANAFIKALGEVSTVQPYFYYTFYNTGMNVLTKAVTDAVAEKCWYRDFRAPLGPSKDLDPDYVIYLERLALNNFKSYYCLWESTRGTNYFMIKVIDENGKIISNASIDDFFDDNTQMQTLTYFNPFTDATTAFDFSKGLPKSITTANICSFGRNYDNFINLEKIFNKNHNITFSGFYFFNSINLLNNTPVDLFNMFFEENDGEVTAKVIFDSNYSEISMGYVGGIFSKTITKKNFYKILNYFKEHNINRVRGFFRNAIITDATEDILENQLKPFIELPYAFYDCSFENSKKKTIYVDVTNAFGKYDEDDLLGDRNTKYNLHYTFYKNNLKLFTNRFNILNVNDLEGTFSECSYDYTDVNTFSLVSVSLMQPIKAYNRPLLPNDFFEICSSVCALANCFYYLSWNLLGLSGYLPEEDTWGLSKVMGKLDYMFYKCNIIYHPKKTDKGTKYIIFPNWYNKLNFIAKYFVYIPFPSTDTTSDGVVYLFESATAVFNGKFSMLPILAEGQSSSMYYDLPLLNTFYQDSTIKYCYKVALDSDTFPNNNTAYKNLIPRELALVLYIQPNSTIVDNIDVKNTENKPLIINYSTSYNLMYYSSALKGFSLRASYFFGEKVDEEVQNILK